MASTEALPWARLVANLDDPDQASRTTVTQVIDQLLVEKATLRERAILLAPLVAGLQTAEGRFLGLNILVNHAKEVTELREIFLKLTYEADERLMRLGAAAIMQFLDYPPARARVIDFVSDESPILRDLGIRAFPQLATMEAERPPSARLAVIPDPSVNAEALDILERMEQALRTLQDIAPDDIQDRILTTVVFPSIAALRELFESHAANSDELSERRRSSILEIGGLRTAASVILHGAPATIQLLANGDDAALTVKKAGEALYSYGQMIGALLM